MRKKALLGIAAAVVLAAWGWAGWQTARRIDPQYADGLALEEVSKALGVNVRDGELVSHEDTHGGMGNDGNTFSVVSFPDGRCLRRVEGSWKPLPLTENLRMLLYGGESRSPWLSGVDGENPLPVIENGYYTFRDRHAEAADPYSDFEIFRRASFNFTVGLYDTDTGTLYYLKADT